MILVYSSHPAYYFNDGLYRQNLEYIKNTFPDIKIVDAKDDLVEAYRRAARETTTGYFWAFDSSAEPLYFNPIYNLLPKNIDKIHIWPQRNPHSQHIYRYGGLALVPAKSFLGNTDITEWDIKTNSYAVKRPIQKRKAATEEVPHDVIFLSYNEPNADKNYEKLKKRIPYVKRVRGVKGIFNAHKKAAAIADTKMFYVIDADAVLLDDFDFNYIPLIWDEDVVHTWRSKNPVNDLEYGYGGLKLFPTQAVRDATEWRIDFTTSVTGKFKPMPRVSNYTRFNTDPFGAWKSAFRECTKLASSVIHNNNTIDDDGRLNAWCNIGEDKPFGKYVIAGAIAGRDFGKEHADNTDMIDKINDFVWLENEFVKEYFMEKVNDIINHSESLKIFSDNAIAATNDIITHPINKKILIISEPRVGSTFLIHTVSRHLGININEDNTEPLNNLVMYRYIIENNISIREYIERYITNNSILKCHIDQISDLQKYFAIDVSRYFDLVIRIRRKDAVAQNKSLAIAKKDGFYETFNQTKQKWGSKYAREYHNLPAQKISSGDIEDIENQLNFRRKEFDKFCSNIRCDMDIWFEDIINDTKFNAILNDIKKAVE